VVLCFTDEVYTFTLKENATRYGNVVSSRYDISVSHVKCIAYESSSQEVD